MCDCISENCTLPPSGRGEVESVRLAAGARPERSRSKRSSGGAATPDPPPRASLSVPVRRRARLPRHLGLPPSARAAGHKNAVLEVHWTPDGERLVSCSPDKTVRAWDAESGTQLKKMAEHRDIVNSCCPLRRGPPLLVSAAGGRRGGEWEVAGRQAAVDVGAWCMTAWCCRVALCASLQLASPLAAALHRLIKPLLPALYPGR